MASVAAARSPSSPRLPSPPPMAELQIAPKSPILADSLPGSQIDLGNQNTVETGPTRRIRPGTKSIDMASGPPLISLNELDSAFQLQEHLKSLYHNHTYEGSKPVPLTKESAQLLATPPVGVDRSLWLYELCRLLTNNLNTVIVAFFNDTPPCSSITCPEMRASEWQYLCAVHDPPKSCCAIDYCCHTLDSSANMLTSTKHFPSRLSLGVAGDSAGSGGGAQQGLRHLTNIFRRLYRIFAHAWFQHRRMFWQLESEKGLYLFFKAVCDHYHLIPEDSYTIPAEAEGGLSESKNQPDSIDIDQSGSLDQHELPEPALPPESGAAPTQRRHKSTPSTGAFVNTVPEEDETDESGHAKTSKAVPASAMTLTEKTGISNHSPTALSPPLYFDSSSLSDKDGSRNADKSTAEEEKGTKDVKDVKETTEQNKSSDLTRADEKAEAKVLEAESQDEKQDPDEEAVVKGSKTEIEDVEVIDGEDVKESENANKEKTEATT